MLLVIDSNYVGWTCAFALSAKGLTYRGGPSGVIFGFMKQLLTLLEKFEPTSIAFCWDSRASKRKEIYPEYKANRRKDLSEEDEAALALVYQQFDEIRINMLHNLGFANIFTLAGYESDDLIARLVIANCNPDNTVIISSDSDLYQLLDYCSLYSITKAQSTDREIFERHYGINPDQWIDVKAMGGCGTDNVRGIEGIGEKKAIGYLTGKLNHGKMFLKIQSSQDIIMRNIRLVMLPFEGTPLPKMRSDNLDMEKFTAVCHEYGMNSLLEKKNMTQWEKIISRIH